MKPSVVELDEDDSSEDEDEDEKEEALSIDGEEEEIFQDIASVDVLPEEGDEKLGKRIWHVYVLKSQMGQHVRTSAKQ